MDAKPARLYIRISVTVRIPDAFLFGGMITQTLATLTQEQSGDGLCSNEEWIVLFVVVVVVVVVKLRQWEIRLWCVVVVIEEGVCARVCPKLMTRVKRGGTCRQRVAASLNLTITCKPPPFSPIFTAAHWKAGSKTCSGYGTPNAGCARPLDCHFPAH